MSVIAETVAPPVKERKPRKPRAKPQRFARLDGKPTVDEPAVLTLHVGGDETAYSLRIVSSDFGEVLRLTKLIPTEGGPPELGEVYDVILEDAYTSAPTCTCKGHGRWGHCKHADAVKALHDAGRL
jgi:hypothetical protein